MWENPYIDNCLCLSKDVRQQNTLSCAVQPNTASSDAIDKCVLYKNQENAVFTHP